MTSGEEAALASKNVELGLLGLPFVQKFSEWVGFGETAMRLLRSCRIKPEIPTEHLSYKDIVKIIYADFSKVFG